MDVLDEDRQIANQCSFESTPNLEEADSRIIVHVYDMIKTKNTKIVVLSNYTDVFVALLYHMSAYLVIGLEELWFRAGTGDKTRFIPLHK